MSMRGVDDWSEQKRTFDHAYRRTGKTTRLCEAVAEALWNDAELHVIITGAHVIRQEGYYRRLLHEAGADLSRIKFVAPMRIERAVMGIRARLYCDDFPDLGPNEMRAVVNAEAHLGMYGQAD